MSISDPKTRTLVLQALANFDGIWFQLLDKGAVHSDKSDEIEESLAAAFKWAMPGGKKFISVPAMKHIKRFNQVFIEVCGEYPVLSVVEASILYIYDINSYGIPVPECVDNLRKFVSESTEFMSEEQAVAAYNLYLRCHDVFDEVLI